MTSTVHLPFVMQSAPLRPPLEAERTDSIDALGLWSEEAVRLAYHLTRDREAALDLSQDAFVTAIDALPSLEKSASGRVWFMRIVVNLCRDWLRRKSVERKAIRTLAANSGHVQDRSEKGKAELERVREAMMALPLDYREALALVAVESYSPRDAAAVLGLAEGTLRWRLFEARRLLSLELNRVKG